MILYHGSNVEIRQIDLNKSARGQDFGTGFYLSEDEKQAEEMAKNARRFYKENFDFEKIFKEKMLPLYNKEKEKK